MSKETFPLTTEQVFQAENIRTQGNANQAAEMTRPVIDFPAFSLLDSLSEDETTRLMMAARINVVSNTSLATRSWEASKVADHLGDAKLGIQRVYENPQIREAARTIDTDTRGNRYEFRTEMIRDEVNYLLNLAALTGNNALVALAIDKLNEVLKFSQEPTARTLTEYERNRLLIRERLISFKEYKQSAQGAIQESEKIGRWERATTVASRYALDSLRRGKLSEFKWGRKQAEEAGNKDEATKSIFRRQFLRAGTESVRHLSWRITGFGKDYSYLDLNL